jgi:hypothetical protein
VELANEQTKLFVAKLTILLVLRRPELSSLGLDQRIQSIDLLACLELFLLLGENSSHPSSHLHQFVARL